MPDISIIVPVYNVENYLRRCIDSILNQSLTNFELILVDDGSVDESGIICDEYASNDSRIVVIHQKNQGLSGARNSGIEIAKAKYLLFCDSDDTVDSHWCEFFYNVIKKNQNAFVVCDVLRVKHFQNNIPSIQDYQTKPIELNYFNLYKLGLSAYACNKVYNQEIIKTNHIRFDTSVRFAEDVGFNCIYYTHCVNCLFIPQKLYHYWQNDGSIMNRYYSNYLSLHLPLFKLRIPLIGEEDMEEYCDIWAFHFLNLLENVFDNRNTEMTLIEKLKYNQSIICSDEIQFCIAHASLKKENAFMMHLLKRKNYYLYWFLQQFINFKRMVANIIKR